MSTTASVCDALLLTGPLGAGKTTLIERSLVPALSGRRLVVLVNDAGSLPFDGMLLGATGIPIRAVAEGCFCCHAGGRMLEALAEIRDRLAPELLLLEGSGLSPPAPLAAALASEGYRLLGTIGVLAASQLPRLSRDPLVRAQLAAAGLIVLTGAEGLDRAAFAAARSLLRSLTPASVLPAFEGVIRGPLALLLAPGTGSAALEHGALHAGIATVTITVAGLPRRGELCAWLAAAPPSVLRVKGLIQCAEHAAPLALNHALAQTDLRPLAARDAPGLWVAYEGALPEAWLAARPKGVRADDWAALEDCLVPLGACDARTGAAFIAGACVEPLAAAEALLDRLVAARRVAVLTTPAARAGAEACWGGLVDDIRSLPDARYTTLDRTVGELDADLLVLTGMPDALAERIAEQARDRATVHLARRFALPGPSVSMRIEPKQEAALAQCARREARSGR